VVVVLLADVGAFVAAPVRRPQDADHWRSSPSSVVAGARSAVPSSTLQTSPPNQGFGARIPSWTRRTIAITFQGRFQSNGSVSREIVVARDIRGPRGEPAFQNLLETGNMPGSPGRSMWVAPGTVSPSPSTSGLRNEPQAGQGSQFRIDATKLPSCNSGPNLRNRGLLEPAPTSGTPTHHNRTPGAAALIFQGPTKQDSAQTGAADPDAGPTIHGSRSHLSQKPPPWTFHYY